MKKDLRFQKKMSLPVQQQQQQQQQHAMDMEEEEEDEDITNDNIVGHNHRKSGLEIGLGTDIPFLRKNNCPNRRISRDLSIDILDESSSSLLMIDTGNDQVIFPSHPFVWKVLQFKKYRQIGFVASQL